MIRYMISMRKSIKNILFKTDKICTGFFWIFGLIPVLILAYMVKSYSEISAIMIMLFLCINSGFAYAIIFLLGRVRDELGIFYNCGSSRGQLAVNIAGILLEQYAIMIVIGIIFYVGVF